ncbi:DUF6328 family protein [Smaragdicoccus niigatensis]|uniref:DUF6328 family protein n=1 Tax=Smaragdicoccus niigatensis TaxID=359359 RepID=UPI000366B14B|nr:DUF6328 family protein [Smaragdicoccus niigatensis]
MSDLTQEDWSLKERHETSAQRLDRNWSSLLQELRVVQTGVQLLTGFLLTLPFQQHFDTLSPLLKGVYLVAVAASVMATLLLVSPVAAHRILFRQRKLEATIMTAHRLALAGLGLLGIALAAVTFIIFAVVAGSLWSMVACGVAVAAFVIFWIIVPTMQKPSHD